MKLYNFIKNISFIVALVAEVLLFVLMIKGIFDLIDEGYIGGLILSIMFLGPIHIFLRSYSYEEVKDALGITFLEKWCQKHS